MLLVDLDHKLCSAASDLGLPCLLYVPVLWVQPVLVAQLDAPSDWRPGGCSWMRRPTGDQEVAGSIPAEVGNILSWRLIMKYFLRSFSPFC